MLGYILLGSFIGAVAGHFIPPGSFLWFILGASGGYIARQYIDHRRY